MISFHTPTHQDISFMLEVENDQKDWIYSETTEPYSFDQLVQFVLDKHELNSHGQQRFIIKDDKTSIGIIDLYDYNDSKKTAWVGIIIYSKLRENKYGANSLKEFCLYCKDKLELNYLFAKIQRHNRPSIRLFENDGFLFEHVITSPPNEGTTLDYLMVYKKQLIR